MGDRGPGKLILRTVVKADLSLFHEYQLDPEACRMADFPARERDSFMALWKRILTNSEIVKRTIVFDGQVAGNIVSFEEDGLREIGYWLGRVYWGQGIATRALTEFLEIVTIRPLYAHVAKVNHASRRVLEKCGFVVIEKDEKELTLELRA